MLHSSSRIIQFRKLVQVSSTADLYGQSLKVQSPRITYSAESFKHCYTQDLKGIEL